MTAELCSIRQSVICYAKTFDAAALAPLQAQQVVTICAQIEASLSSVKALAATRAAQGNAWQQLGYRSAADQLADQTGTTTTSARRTLDTGRRLADQPVVAQAALAGELSPQQASAVADGTEADPARASELVELAKTSSLPELNEHVTKIKAARADLEAQHRARHTRRSLRKWTDRDGALHVHMYGHPEDGTQLWRMLDPIRRRLNILRRHDNTSPTTAAPATTAPATASPTVDSLDNLDYDALMTVVSAALGKEGELSLADLLALGLFPQMAQSRPPSPAESIPPANSEPSPARSKKLAGSPLRVMIRVDLDALLRGVPVEGELCEIAGVGPVPVSVVKDLLATDNPFIVGILTRAESLVGVYHHGRHPNAHQRSALDFLYPTCAAQGCPTRAGLQYDHRTDWATTKITAYDLLDRLCRHHHNLKTHRGWALVPGRGKRAFVDPNDPRHPHHQPPTPNTNPPP